MAARSQTLRRERSCESTTLPPPMVVRRIYYWWPALCLVVLHNIIIIPVGVSAATTTPNTTTTTAAAAAAAAAAAGRCAAAQTTKTRYYCPNCGGIQVKDCSSHCVGYRFPDSSSSSSLHNGNICIDRTLFQTGSSNKEEDKQNNNIPGWLPDLACAVLWFLLSAIAIASGVGGGGLFFPLGILLLHFPPPAAAGLSQASVLGAGLGGFLINLHCLHPNEKIRHEPGSITTTTTTTTTRSRRTIQTEITREEERTYLKSGGEFYTRPVIDYDMTLFMAPVQLAGALIGALAERLLPSWLSLLAAGLILSVVSYLTYQKYIAAYREERKRKKVGQFAAAEPLPAALDQKGKIDALAVVDVGDVGEQEAQLQSSGQQTSAYHSRSDVDVGRQTTAVGASFEKGDGHTDYEPLRRKSYPRDGASLLSVVSYLTYPLHFAAEKGGQLLTAAAAAATLDSKDKMNVNGSAVVEAGYGGEQELLLKPSGHQISAFHSYSDVDVGLPPAAASYSKDDANDHETRQRKAYLRDAMRLYPVEKLATLVVMWVGVFVLTLMVGGQRFRSIIGINCHSPWYAALLAAQLIWLFAFAILSGRFLLAQQQNRVAVRYPFLPDDPIWDMQALWLFGISTFLAGLVSGFIGVGGGMILGPLALMMGLNPKVSSATIATMIIITSSSVAFMFVTSGLVPVSYAAFYFVVCFLGASWGQRKINNMVKETGHTSLLVFILASIIGLSTIGCFVILLTMLSQQDWCLDGFKEFCVVSEEAHCPLHV